MESKNTRSFWRGYIDAQGKKDWTSGFPIATAKTRKRLKPLADMLDLPIESYRSGYRIMIQDIEDSLPSKLNVHYARGWFYARGQKHKDPIKLTVTGREVSKFAELVQNVTNIALPKPMKPSRTSESMRLIITGEKAEQLNDWLYA